jgi:hypothetical protein
MLRDRGLALQNRPLGATMREPRRKADAQLRAQSGPKGANDLIVADANFLEAQSGLRFSLPRYGCLTKSKLDANLLKSA